MWGASTSFTSWWKKAAQPSGQDGAGIAASKAERGTRYPYMHRIRSAEEQAIPKIFKTIATEINELIKYNKDIPNHPGMMKGHVRFMGELLGHLDMAPVAETEKILAILCPRYNTIPVCSLAIGGKLNLVKYRRTFERMNMEPTTYQKKAIWQEWLNSFIRKLIEEEKNHPKKPVIVKVLKRNSTRIWWRLHGGRASPPAMVSVSFSERCAQHKTLLLLHVNDELSFRPPERAAIRTAFNVCVNEVKELMPG